MRVVLRKSAHAQQPMHHAAALIAIHRAQLAQPHRQLAIAAQLVAINQDVARTVHRLQAVLRVVQLHAREHIFRVMLRCPEVFHKSARITCGV